MIKMKYTLTAILCFGLMSLFAFRNPDKTTPAKTNQVVSYRMDCAQAIRQTDLDVNNVRARLLVGGDVWWDGNNGRYIVPNVEPGEVEVSSIFAGAVWLGGVDPAGNLKLAAQTYGTSSGTSDFWPGPLTEVGIVDAETCSQWDNFFTVTGEEIDIHLALFAEAQAAGEESIDPNLIPAGVRGWPGLGNEFFFDIFGFELPDAEQGLGAFFDENLDGLYTPQFGDYPIIEIRGCPTPQYPDEMKFWIYNDAGNIHTQTGADAIQMEIQVQAFAYATNDELNNMTFSRYKLINRGQESIDSTYFAMWVDADLGCFDDDYIGCDTTRSLMYIYNADAVDGSSGTTCTGGVETYGNDIPYLGVDYFRGPLAPKVFNADSTLRNPAIGEAADTIVEIGMTSFVYYNNPSETTVAAQEDPNTAAEFYNYLTGSWRDGTPVTFGGSGLGGTVPVDFVLPDAPNDNNGWSMCTAQLPEEDRRTVQASGPFRLDPGRVNELIIGVPWVPNVASYPCPDMGRLQRADDIAQGLFDSCFDIVDGPDAPDVNWVELDQRLIAVLTNEEGPQSNNSFLQYSERDQLAPTELADEDANYVFEGYLVYQLADINVTIDELSDPDRARLVFQSDIENEVSTVYNWIEGPNPLDPAVNVFSPELQVEGNNRGLRNTFELTNDIFSGDPLINHTTYYYTAIAYAYNSWEPFDVNSQFGQTTPYLEGRRNIQTYAVTPRPIADRNLNSEYGNGAIITRLDGVGVGGNFLVLSKAERERLMSAQTDAGVYEGDITYEPGNGPVAVSVVDPLRVVDGDYILRLDQSAALETGNSSWELFSADSGESLGRASQSLVNQNEELFPDLGISITIQQTTDAGDISDPTNGAIGQTISYEDETQSWLRAVPDNAFGIEGLAGFVDVHFQPTAGGELNSDLDPNQDYTNLGSGHFAPYTLMDWTTKENFYATPAWINGNSSTVQQRNPMSNLNNVDIVYTNNKDLWSRCIVVETGNRYYSDAGFELDDNVDNFEIVTRPSVGKEDNDGDGRPDPDGTGTGYAWFPGYAIDVETGERLNIFFGENSAYGDNTLAPELLESVNGSDMMFNPSSQAGIPPAGGLSAYNLVLGGMHYMYVTKQPYDQCAAIGDVIGSPQAFLRLNGFSEITWAGIPLLNEGASLLSYADGLIPTETVVSLRVDSPYATQLGTNDNNTYPSYQFSIDGQEASALTTEDEINSQLDMINVVPNPYLAFSAYENSQFNNVVKITNLPAKCTVTIYSLDGQFIRQYQRDEAEIMNEGNNPGVSFSQINPAIEWDVKNASGIPVSSGVYLIHVTAEGLGERVIKWFGVNRQFDPSGL